MKIFAISTALALLAGLSQAAPAEAARPFGITVEFIGAAGADFFQTFPGDGTKVPISNRLSISKIYNLGGGTCTFYGVDGSVTTVGGGQTVDVGPPQTQVSGYCRGY